MYRIRSVKDGLQIYFSDEILPHYVGQKSLTRIKRKIRSLSLNRQAISRIFPNSNPNSVSKISHSDKSRGNLLTRGFELRLMRMLNTIKFEFFFKNGGLRCFAHIAFYFVKEIYCRKGVLRSRLKLFFHSVHENVTTFCGPSIIFLTATTSV